MIDLHIHIIPGVDDGSRDMDLSLEMAAIAVENGIRAVCATPHFGFERAASRGQLLAAYRALEEELKIEQIPLDLTLGMEIFATRKTPERLKKGEYWTLNHSRYYLIEFDFFASASFIRKTLKECEGSGLIPIIAHPARYACVREAPQIAFDWISRGYGVQLNRESILGYYGEDEEVTARELLRHRCVTIVATDAHGVNYRPPLAAELTDYLHMAYGEEYTYLLTEENPGRILRNQPLVGYDPIPFRDERMPDEDEYPEEREEWLSDEDGYPAERQYK